MLLTPAQTEPESFELRRTLFFLPGVDASHVYVRARALGCFQSYQYQNLWEGADRVGGQLRGDKREGWYTGGSVSRCGLAVRR